MKRMLLQAQRARLRRKRQAGFSLIELLVVISIILIILFFAVPKMTSIQANARETGAISTMKTIYASQIQYQSTFNKFAGTLAQLGPPAGDKKAGPIFLGLKRPVSFRAR